MGFLYRLGVAPDWIKVDKLSMILGLFLRPDHFHRFDLLSQNFPTFLEGGPVVLHLFRVPSASDAKDQATVAELIDGRYLLGHRDGVSFDRQANTAAELDRLGGRRRRSECDKEIMRVPILLREISAGRKWGPAACR